MHILRNTGNDTAAFAFQSLSVGFFLLTRPGIWLLISSLMVADFAREGEDFYDREKPSIGRLEDYVRKGAGFHEERHAVFTLEFWVSARSFADNREKLEGLLLRSGFYPLYKD